MQNAIIIKAIELINHLFKTRKPGKYLKFYKEDLIQILIEDFIKYQRKHPYSGF